MKLNKLFVFAASALLFCGACNNSDKEVTPQPVEDAISINPQKTTVGSKGGEVPVLVTSSGAWTLKGEANDYVTPSATEGKDGDVVTFTVKANEKEVDQIFSYTFTCGTKSAALQITLKKMASQSEEQLEIFYPEGSNQLTHEGGKVTVRVPRGYAADYVLGTTSGDIRLYAIDVDKVKVNTTSGDVRVEPDAGIRAKEIDVTTISGRATVSACAGDVVVNTVSGRQFVSCDANRADLSVVSGRIHAEGASEEWEINSVSGDIEVLCTVAPTRKMQFNSMSANAHVALPGDIRGFVADISGMSGKVVNEFGPNRYGTCALPIHMDTMSGKLMITRL